MVDGEGGMGDVCFDFAEAARKGCLNFADGTAFELKQNVVVVQCEGNRAQKEA